VGSLRCIQFGFQSIEEQFAIRSFAAVERSDAARNLLINLLGRVFLSEFASYHEMLDGSTHELLSAPRAASLNLFGDQPFDLSVQLDTHWRFSSHERLQRRPSR